jgi:Holliday junction resolvase RusA-like endonuclease
LKSAIEFEFFEPPRGKERPRLFVKNGKTFAFTPKSTRLYEKRLGDFVSKIMTEKNFKQFDEKIPLKCVVCAFYPIPKFKNKSVKQKMQNGEIFPTLTPDCDNCLKIILDALNGVCFADDSQICDVVFLKRYGLVPKISVKIRELKT